MTPPSCTALPVRLAYLHLLRSSLRAVKFSKPARYVLLSRLRAGFRSSPASAYCPVRLARTLELLRGAAEANGIEHRLLRTLVHYWWPEHGSRRARSYGRADMYTRARAVRRSVDGRVEDLGRTLDVYV